jgi:hypothetical protein
MTWCNVSISYCLWYIYKDWWGGTLTFRYHKEECCVGQKFSSTPSPIDIHFSPNFPPQYKSIFPPHFFPEITWGGVLSFFRFPRN